MLNPSVETWTRFAGWMVAGSAGYFGYGRIHSRLDAGRER